MIKIINSFFIKKDGDSFHSQIKNIDSKEKIEKYLKNFEIEQGDIISNFPDNFLEIEFIKPLAFIIANYTCDIPKSTTSMLHLLPIYPFKRLSLELFKNYIETTIKIKRREEIGFQDYDINNIESCLNIFRSLNSNEKKKFIDVIKSIFQFNNRNYFLICPHEFNKNVWCYTDVQMIFTFDKEEIYPQIIEYINHSINSPWKEKFGSVIGSRFNKIAVDDFSSDEIKEILETKLFDKE